MRTSNLYKKLSVSFIMAGTILAFGSVYQSMQVTSTDFMNDTEIKFVKRFDESQDRIIASAERELKAIQYLPVNEKNAQTINKKWEIIRIEDEKGQEVYNKNKEERKIVVDLNLVRTSQIQINDDNNYLFDLSFLHESGSTIALFRSFGTGYEIIEAVAVTDKNTERTEIREEDSFAKIESKPELNKSDIAGNLDNVDLTLERALVPSLDGKVLIGEEYIRGEASIANGSIQGLTVTAEKNNKSVEISISDIPLETGGSFVTEIDGVESRGIVTNNGKDAYRVRFATGPYKGALLNFVTAEELERITEEREEFERLQEERSYENEVQSQNLEVVQTQASSDRKSKQDSVIDAGYKAEETADEVEQEDVEQEQYDQEISAEEVDQEVERQGYSF